jgi:hypothetical protein
MRTGPRRIRHFFGATDHSSDRSLASQMEETKKAPVSSPGPFHNLLGSASPPLNRRCCFPRPPARLLLARHHDGSSWQMSGVRLDQSEWPNLTRSCHSKLPGKRLCDALNRALYWLWGRAETVMTSAGTRRLY